MTRAMAKLGIGFITCIFLSGTGTAIGTASPSSKPIHVALLVDKLDVFWTHFSRITQVAAAQLGMRVTVVHGHESHLGMLREARALAESKDKPDVIMFKSFKGNGRQIMQIAADHAIKSFSLNAPIVLPPYRRPESPFLIGELLPDDQEAGYRQVETLRDEMKKQGVTTIHMVAINGNQGDSPAQLRERGLRHAIADFKDITFYQLISDAWTAPNTAHQFEILRKRYPKINAVWSGNDTIALHIVEQAHKSGYRLGQNLFVGGIDISPEGLMAVKRGDLVTTVGGHILDGGRALAILHDYFALGKLTKTSLMTPMEPVTRATVDAFFKILDPLAKAPIDFIRLTRAKNPEKPYDFSFPKH